MRLAQVSKDCYAVYARFNDTLFFLGVFSPIHELINGAHDAHG